MPAGEAGATFHRRLTPPIFDTRRHEARWPRPSDRRGVLELRALASIHCLKHTPQAFFGDSIRTRGRGWRKTPLRRRVHRRGPYS